MQSIELDNSVAIYMAAIDEFREESFNMEEIESLGPNAVRKRIIEFHAGRCLARLALQNAGIKPQPVRKMQNRLPSWPTGVVAAISHTDSHVAVALALSSRIKGIGLDIEIIHAVDERMEDSILNPAEREEVHALQKDPTDYFSAKEALFKACFPLHNEYFDMLDVVIEFDRNRFNCLPQAKLNADLDIRGGSGFFTYSNNHVISLFRVDKRNAVPKL